MASRAKFQRAVHDGQYYLIEADYLAKRKQDAAAEAVLVEGLEIFPDNPQLWHARAKITKFDLTRDNDTIGYLATAYSLDPTDKYIAMDYASFMTRRGQHDQAERVYAHIYKDEGDRAPILCAMGNLYQKRGMMENAAACFGRAMMLPDGDVYAQNRYLEVAQNHGVCFNTENWNNFQERVKTALTTAFAAPFPAPQPRG